MHQYIDEGQYRDIFSTLQILVGISPNNVKYMANTTSEAFNKDFAFNWQRKSDNGIVRNWKEFADSMLSIPMAHQMATNYMILDGTKNKETLKVMRPYQVYATQNVINGLRQVDFDLGTNKVGYIWHTTGSGKTITSFKTAWLASRMPKIDKVVFLVDRIALTKQTSENYRAYDPDYDPDIKDELTGSVRDTDSTRDLSRKLKSKDNNIIVTSVQKLDKLIKRKSFNPPIKTSSSSLMKLIAQPMAIHSKQFRRLSSEPLGSATPEHRCSTTRQTALGPKTFSASCSMHIQSAKP